MPFASEAQRRFMYAKHPRLAARWSKEYPHQGKLPEHVKKSGSVFGALAAAQAVAAQAEHRKAACAAEFSALLTDLALALPQEKRAGVVALQGHLLQGSDLPSAVAAAYPAYSDEQRLKLAISLLGLWKEARELSETARKRLPKSDFARPSHAQSAGGKAHSGSYPIPDAQHARAALGFAAMHHGKGSPLYHAIAAKVHAKYPGMGKEGEEGAACNLHPAATGERNTRPPITTPTSGEEAPKRAASDLRRRNWDWLRGIPHVEGASATAVAV